VRLPFREEAALPFSCHPVKLFCFVWLTMLTALSFHVSESSYQTMGIPALMFAVSLASLVCGYFLARLFCFGWTVSREDPAHIGIDYVALRKINWVFVVISIGIILINLKVAGLPPALGFFGFDTKDYLEYGKMKQILFPLLVALLVNSSLDPSYRFKALFGGFGAVAMVLYLTRLNLLLAVFEIVAFFTLTSKVKTRTLYLIAFITLLCGILAANYLGNNRTSRDIFMAFLQIKSSYSDAPMPFLWAASYLSIPLSNLSWIVHEFHFQGLHFSSIYPLLPAFWTPDSPHQSFLDSDARVIDGAHTYLATYFMDASFGGVIAINLFIGLLSVYFMSVRMRRSPLVFAVLLGCIAFLFFSDQFTPLSTLILVLAQRTTERWAMTFDDGAGRVDGGCAA
jgi:oligosaccharide repeat unit polymerase